MESKQMPARALYSREGRLGFIKPEAVISHQGRPGFETEVLKVSVQLIKAVCFLRNGRPPEAAGLAAESILLSRLCLAGPWRQVGGVG